MAGRLAGKRAVITAAGQGIGRASAEAFIREGADVVATDLSDALLADLGGCTARPLDVADAAAIAALAAEVGPIDVLFNCAGIVHAGTVLDCSDGDWDKARISEAEYRKTFESTDAQYAQMLQSLVAALKKSS